MKSILVIEDNDEIRENIAEILSLANYNVLTASDGKTGTQLAITNHPDLIICDIVMPGLDGYGVLHLLKRNPLLKRTPFIFLSGKAEQSDIRHGMNIGADDYLVKPFSGTDLLAAIESRFQKEERTFVPDQMVPSPAAKQMPGTRSFEEFVHLVQTKNNLRFRKKQLIFSEGTHPLFLYFIHKGKVKVFKTNEDGKELVVKICHERDFLGYIALLEGAAYKVTAEAIEDCEMAVMPKKEFEDQVNGNSKVGQHFLKLLARDVSEREQQLVHIAYNSLRKKVADALLMVAEKYKTAQDGPTAIDISRENLASIAGTATESLIRTLSDFKNEKLIEINEGRICILQEKKLRMMVN